MDIWRKKTCLASLHSLANFTTEGKPFWCGANTALVKNRIHYPNQSVHVGRNRSLASPEASSLSPTKTQFASPFVVSRKKKSCRLLHAETISRMVELEWINYYLRFLIHCIGVLLMKSVMRSWWLTLGCFLVLASICSIVTAQVTCDVESLGGAGAVCEDEDEVCWVSTFPYAIYVCNTERIEGIWTCQCVHYLTVDP